MEWVLMLPDTLERQAIQKGIAEGRAEGLRNALSLVLSRRFGEETAEEAQPALERLTNADTLRQLLDLALTAPDSQTVIDALQQAASEQSED
ncbi:MAG: hypothetical protein N2651_09745 [Fimbriimonadales bacterium]|nr:hypothetical protein [Fimbriimonadales bacterium]